MHSSQHDDTGVALEVFRQTDAETPDGDTLTIIFPDDRVGEEYLWCPSEDLVEVEP